MDYSFSKKLPRSRPIKMKDNTFFELGMVQAELSKKEQKSFSMEETLIHLINLYNSKEKGLFVNI